MSKKKVFMVPADGGRVRKELDPTRFVDEKGEFLPFTIYYRRRINRGELLLRESEKTDSVQKVTKKSPAIEKKNK